MDPLKHHRRSIRLTGFDYASPDAYFVTICAWRGELFFDRGRARQIAEACWREIPAHAPSVELDEWVVMPNHIHGIIVIREAHNDIKGRGVQPTQLRRGQVLNALQPTMIQRKAVMIPCHDLETQTIASQ